MLFLSIMLYHRDFILLHFMIWVHIRTYNIKLGWLFNLCLSWFFKFAIIFPTQKLTNFNSTSCANRHEFTLKITNTILQNIEQHHVRRSGARWRHYCGCKRHHVTYYSFLKVYNLVYITLIVASHLFLVNSHEPSTV